MIEFIIKYWLEILFGLLISAISFLITKCKMYKKTNEFTKDGIKVILKAKITELYNEIIEKNCISFEEKELFLELYHSYKNLGGNGFIKDLMNDINKLTIKKDC